MHAMGIDDAYQVVRVLADGRGGTTELVTIEDAGPFVRKKIPQVLANRGVWATLADCACSRLPQVVATYELPDRFVVVYEYVPGTTLEQAVEASGALQPAEACQTVLDICEVVETLHGHGVVHRDIAPANIVIAADGAHLIDLGIAWMPGRDSDAHEAALGTWGYASPEQHGFAATDARSDVYSLGRVLGYLLTGVCPAEKEYASALAADAVPKDLRAVVERASAFEPSARYQSVAAFASALEAATGDRADVHVGGEGRASAAPARDAASGAAGERLAEDDGASMGGTAVAGHPTRRRIAIVALAVVALAVVGTLLVLPRVLDDGAAVGPQTAPATTEEEGEQDGAPLDDSAPEDAEDAASPLIDSNTTAPSFDPADLQIVESGWWAEDMGYVWYGFAPHNASDTVRVDMPEIVITGRDASGSVVFTQEQVLCSIMPGETQYFGGMAGNGIVPESVAFEVAPPMDYFLRSTTGTPARYEVRDVHTALDQLGGTIVTGEIALMEEGVDCFEDTMGDVAAILILRDGQGSIVYGSATFVNAPALGSSVAFQFQEYQIPEYATIEVHAISW